MSIRELVGGMSRNDSRSWAETTTLAELGELTARWLEGTVGSRPGYMPECGPDEETTDLIPVLATANRAGFVTEVSQPGMPPTEGWDLLMWEQRAGVSGFADDAMAERLTGLERHGFVVLSYATRRHWFGSFRSFGYPMPVTAAPRPGWRSAEGEHVTHGWTVHTAFGGALSRGQVKSIWEGIGRSAMDELLDAWQVTIVDPAWGSNELWKRLADVLPEDGT